MKPNQHQDPKTVAAAGEIGAQLANALADRVTDAIENFPAVKTEKHTAEEQRSAIAHMLIKDLSIYAGDDNTNPHPDNRDA